MGLAACGLPSGMGEDSRAGGIARGLLVGFCRTIPGRNAYGESREPLQRLGLGEEFRSRQADASKVAAVAAEQPAEHAAQPGLRFARGRKRLRQANAAAFDQAKVLLGTLDLVANEVNHVGANLVNLCDRKIHRPILLQGRSEANMSLDSIRARTDVLLPRAG